MARHESGVSLAERTGWRVLLELGPTGAELSRGRVAFCEHPGLPGWKAHPHRSRWALSGRLGGGEPVTWPCSTLWRAIEAGNREIKNGAGTAQKGR